MSSPVTPASLQKNLADMGLRPQDTVLLHTSVRRIGPVEGGAEAVLDALADYFREGLLCFPALSWNTIDAQPPAFDVLRTPSIVGVLPELFRQRPGVVRSWNPTHSMCALGGDAAAFTAHDHLTGTPCGIGSTWHQLLDRDAWILMAGCDLTSCTFLHGVEEWCGIPGRVGEPVAFEVTLPDGERIRVHSAAHCAQPSVHYWKLEAGLRQAGLLKTAAFGNADTLVLRARTLHAFAAGCLSLCPDLFSGTPG